MEWHLFSARTSATLMTRSVHIKQLRVCPPHKGIHYRDVTWASLHLKPPLAPPLVQFDISANTQALHYWPFVRGTCWCLVDSPHKGSVMLKAFLCYNAMIPLNATNTQPHQKWFQCSQVKRSMSGACHVPADTRRKITPLWRQNDVVLTSKWRYYCVIYPLGC